MSSTGSRPEVFHAIPSDADSAVVVFSAVGAMRNGFHYARILDSLPGRSKLFVRDPQSKWYNAGLPGVGDTVDEIATGIERELDRLNVTRVVTFGPSMGGYAAILFGCMLGAERAVALAPQTLLDRRLRHAPPAGFSLQAPDLAPVVSSAPQTRVDVVAGWDDHTDVFHAQRIAGSPSVRVLALRQRLHWAGRELLRDGLLVPLITTLLDGGTPDICEVDPQIEADFTERIADTVYAVRRGDWEEVAERIRPVAERHPQWAAPNFDLGTALTRLNDWQGAEVALERAIEANPRWGGPRAQLAEILLRQNRTPEAERLTRTGLALNPNWKQGPALLDRCISQLGKDRPT